MKPLVKKLERAKTKADKAAATTAGARKAAFADGSLDPKEERTIQRSLKKQSVTGAKVSKLYDKAKKKKLVE